MRAGLIAMVMAGLPATVHAQQRMPDAPQRAMASREVAMVYIAASGALPPREIEVPARPATYREYRVDPSFHAERSAHTRALDEMNAINMRRPRPFRFRPVMALTFDAADMDGPAKLSGIAPNLMGLKTKR